MQTNFETIKIKSIKEVCVARLEDLILSGELKIGERLPSERDFALQIGVSRPVLHEALVDLDSKGLVQIIPRRGVFVSDYRRSGSLAILSSLLAYQNGRLDDSILQSLIDMRLVFESESARLAALNRTSDQMDEFNALVIVEQGKKNNNPQVLTDTDFIFHQLVAIASGNLVYPLVINSFKRVYTNLTGKFFRKYCGTPIVNEVIQYHIQLVDAFDHKNEIRAKNIMIEMLKHGETYLKGVS
jgi:GntR family transcriptional regulator, transcriptional repressor for pyruvate dehydrogenase complex